MPLTTVPDVEKLVSDYLRSHADIVALNTRIVGKSPSQTSTSWVRVTRIGGGQIGQPDHLSEAMCQFDCYAGATGGQPEVNTLAATVRAVLGSLNNSAIVSGVKILDDHRGLDTDLEPARDVVNLTALIWSHA